jgi:hypothetical protein
LIPPSCRTWIPKGRDVEQRGERGHRQVGAQRKSVGAKSVLHIRLCSSQVEREGECV